MPEPRSSVANGDRTDDSLSGTSVGRFQIADRLGKGGMGEVYRAHDPRLKRSVALKRLGPALRNDALYRRRFLEEAERASSLTDPHVAAIYDVLEENDELFVVMEYVEGETLRKRLRQPMTLDAFLNIALQCAEALVGAHERGIVHCDIKPENIMLATSGQVKILDFGVAKRLPHSGQSSTVDRSGTMAGTPAYMAPEVLLERTPDGRSDIFSLGIVFYEALAGHHPFLSGSFVATADRIRKESPSSLRIFNRDVPEELQAIVERMLAKEPGQRYQSARELVLDLHGLQTGITPVRLQPLLPQREERQKIARRAFLLGALAVLVVTSAIWGAYSWMHPVTPVLAERGWVLIADFDSLGTDPIPDQSAREGLTIALQQSRYVNVFPRSRGYEVLQRMKRPDVTRIDETLGREICQRENLQVLLTGSIQRVGQAYQISVRALDPVHGDLFFAEKEVFQRKEDFFDRIDRLARSVRSDLGESLVGIEKSSRPLAKVTTSSLDALQLYSQAADFMAQGKVEAVPALLQGALQFDSGFAMAHRLTARAYLMQGNSPKEVEHLNRAYELRSAVTDREQRLIEADYYSSRGQYEKEVESLVTLVGLYPDDTEAHGNLAAAYDSAGDVTNAIQQGREVLKRDASSSQAYGFLALLLARDNQGEEALRVYDEAVKRGLESPRLKWARGLALLGRGETAEARRAFQQLQGAGFGWIGRVYLTRTAIYEGKFSEAENLLRGQIRADLSAGNSSAVLLERYLLASTFLVEGRPDQVREQLAAILKEGEPEALQAEDLRRAGMLYARLGDVAAAQRTLRKLDSLRSSFPTAFNHSCYYNLAGEIALAEGHPENAVQQFTAAFAAYPRAVSHAGLGMAFERLQNWDRAEEAWKRVLDAKGEILLHLFPLDWEIAHLELARLKKQLNQDQAAQSYYEQFLHLWRDADNLPLREQAQREYKELTEKVSAGKN